MTIAAVNMQSVRGRVLVGLEKRRPFDRYPRRACTIYVCRVPQFCTELTPLIHTGTVPERDLEVDMCHMSRFNPSYIALVIDIWYVKVVKVISEVTFSSDLQL